VSRARIEITVNVFIPARSFWIVAKNVWAWHIFRTKRRNKMAAGGRQASAPLSPAYSPPGPDSDSEREKAAEAYLVVRRDRIDQGLIFKVLERQLVDVDRKMKSLR
jgi:hypothetical protein